MKEKKKILLASLGILMLVLVTVGVTFAIFTYTKLGTTENTVTTGTLKFLYTENTGIGAGINIENAFPVSDSIGKSYNTDKYVFDFSVEATNSGNSDIPYEVTLRKKSTSTLSESNIKVYLTDMTGEADTEIVAPTLYSDLTQTKIDVGEETEKTLYKGAVLGGDLDYLKDFRLRMWIDENSNQDDVNGKTFVALVNVYSNVSMVTSEDVPIESNTEINTLSINGLSATKVENENYDYEMEVTNGTSSITFDIATENENATVEIEKIDSIAYKENEIVRMASTNTFELTSGDNYFKITITSEDKTNKEEYILKVSVVSGLSGFAQKIYEANPLITAAPTLTTSSNNSSDASGLYMSTDTNSGKPTYYFRGNVENNYVDFAGFTWRIVRINEDGSVRIVLSGGINDDEESTFGSLYYSDGIGAFSAKGKVETWFSTNLATQIDKVETGEYFCEQGRVKRADDYTFNNVSAEVYSSYTPTFKCEDDADGYGLVNSHIGLLTYDEAVFAGQYFEMQNTTNYLYYPSRSFWMMSSSGKDKYGNPVSWQLTYTDGLEVDENNNDASYRPVINLKSNITVTGTGASDDHYVVQQ